MSKTNSIIQLKNATEIFKQLNGLNQQAEKAVSMTVKDFKGRAPAWVSRAASEAYGIKKADVTPAKNNSKAAGKVQTKGDTVSTAVLIYTGKVLTPTRFSMSPKVPKEAYTLKAQIYRGQRKTLGKVKRLTKKQRKKIGKNFKGKGQKNSAKSPIMLMNAGSGKYIPFQRQSQNRKDIKAIRTVSVPQMLGNEEVSKSIEATIQENLSKRMEHYIDRYIGK